MRKLSMLSLIALLSASSAQSWSLVECSPSELQKLAVSKRELERLEAGHAEFVPVPYPKSVKDAADDFVQQFGRLPLDDDEALVLSLHEEGRLRYRVEEIENWTYRRCRVDKDRQRLLLIRGFDQGSDLEVVRGLLGADGTLAGWIVWPAGAPADLLSKTDALQAIADISGRGAADPQYVEALGAEVECKDFNPCVAARSGETVYVVHPDGRIFRFDSRAPRDSFARMNREWHAGKYPRANFEAKGRYTLSLGNDEIVVAERLDVDPASPK